MNKVKKTIAIILCLIMATASLAFAEETQLVSAGAKDYEGHWAQATIQKWMDAGKVAGYPDGSYKPDGNVTRAEFVKLVNGIIDFNKSGNVAYKDVPSTEWYYNYVGIAQEIGYISGYSAEKFGPNDYITREQAASILARIQYLNNNAAGAEKYNDKNEMSSWAIEAVGAASEAGFISGYSDGSFKPSNNLTRAEALTMIDNVMVNAKNLVIYNAGAELKDAVIEGDLIIAKTVGEGDVHLTNLEVKGEVKVLGGGMNSVYFNNVQVAKIEVGKDKVRLVFADGTTVEQLVAGSETLLENTDGTIAKITVTGDNLVTLTGNFGEVTVAGNANITLDEAVITTLVVDQPITIEGTGTIKTLEANADGIQFVAEVTIDKTVVGEGVTEAPAVVEEVISGGGGGGIIPVPTDYDYKFTVTASVTKGDIEKTLQYDSFNQYKGSTYFTNVLGSEISYVKGKLDDPDSLIYKAASSKLGTLNDLINEVESVEVDGTRVYYNNGEIIDPVVWSLLENTSINLTEVQKTGLRDRDMTISEIVVLLGLYNSSTIYNDLNTIGDNILEGTDYLTIVEGIEPDVIVLDAQLYKTFLDEVLNDLLSNDKLVDLDEMSYSYSCDEFGISLRIDLEQLQ